MADSRSIARGASEGQVTVDPAELLAGFNHSKGGPLQRHLSVAPALDLGADVRLLVVAASAADALT
jgi:hypothetical protein